jgi:hypothetical protein
MSANSSARMARRTTGRLGGRGDPGTYLASFPEPFV